MKPYSCLRMFINKNGDVEINLTVFNQPDAYSDDIHDSIDLKGQLHPEQLAMLHRLFASAPKLGFRSLTNWLNENPFLNN